MMLLLNPRRVGRHTGEERHGVVLLIVVWRALLSVRGLIVHGVRRCELLGVEVIVVVAIVVRELLRMLLLGQSGSRRIVDRSMRLLRRRIDMLLLLLCFYQRGFRVRAVRGSVNVVLHSFHGRRRLLTTLRVGPR